MDIVREDDLLEDVLGVELGISQVLTSKVATRGMVPDIGSGTGSGGGGGT